MEAAGFGKNDILQKILFEILVMSHQIQLFIATSIYFRFNFPISSVYTVIFKT